MTRWWRRRRSDDIADEIETHLSLAADEFRRRGLSDADARDAARRALGGELKTRQAYQQHGRWRVLDALGQDVRYAVRALRRDRGFVVTAVLVLGLGIGVNNMMFTLVYGAALRGLPIPDAERVLWVGTFDKQFADRALTDVEFRALQTETRSFAALGAFVVAPFAVGDEGKAPDRFDGAYASTGTMAALHIAPTLGRLFLASDEVPGAARIAILDEQAWRARYSGDAAIVGRSILVDGVPTTVVGVVPDRAGFPSTARVWLPLSQQPAAEPRDARTLRVFGRLQPNATLQEAQGEAAAVVARLSREGAPETRDLTARVVAINQRFFAGIFDPVWLAFISASLLIVAVSCANAANLMVARGSMRAREIAIRGSLGARRLRVVFQLVVEAFVLALVGAGVGLAVSATLLRIFSSLIPSGAMPYWQHFTMDWRVVAALVGISLATVLVFGLVPAIHASRVDVNHTLRDGGRSGTGARGSRRLTAGFLVAELALTIVLIVQVAEDFASRRPPAMAEAQVDSDALVTAVVSLPASRYPTPDARVAFYDRACRQLAALPGIVGCATTSHAPLNGSASMTLELEKMRRDPGEQLPTVQAVAIGTGYFATLDLPIRLGREFAPLDGRPGHEHVLVNQRFADRHFSDGQALGRRLRVTSSAPGVDATWLTVIGVVPDLRQRTTVADADPLIYLPLANSPLRTSTLVVRSALDPAAITAVMREAVAGLDAGVPLYRTMTLKQAMEEANWNGRFSASLIRTITAIALALSIVGLYAVTSYSVGLRTREIGIRVALGARAGQIRWLVVSGAMVQVALGLFFGFVGALAWQAAFFIERFDPSAIRPLVIGQVVTLLVILTLAACAVPARRAAHLDPVNALRQD